MKPYSTGTWGIAFIFRISGSVFPKSIVWALPDALLAVAVSLLYRVGDESARPLWLDLSEEDVSRCVSLMGGYYGVMGFILVFRSQLAYSRWWEGGALLQQLRGEWFNAYSSLLAFCSHSEEDRKDVEAFQHLLMRLMSILYCSALEQVADLKDKYFEIFDIDGVDTESLRFLNTANDKCEVTLQWIQRLIVDSEKNGIITVAPPILSRVFQEFGRGIVNLNHVRKIAEFPFPFPWPQMITVMLITEWLLTPVLAGTALGSPIWASIVTFFVTFAFWNIHYIAQELECPFGDDANDLPLREMQVDMNRSLRQLLERRAQVPPIFEFIHKSDSRIVSSRVIEELGGPLAYGDDTLDYKSGRSSRSQAPNVRWKRRYLTPEHRRQSVVHHHRMMHRRSCTETDLGALVRLGGGSPKSGTSLGTEHMVTASAPVSGVPWRQMAGRMTAATSDGAAPKQAGGFARSLSRGLSFKRLFSAKNKALDPLPEQATARKQASSGGGSPVAWQEPSPPSAGIVRSESRRSFRIIAPEDESVHDGTSVVDAEEETLVMEADPPPLPSPTNQREPIDRRNSGQSSVASPRSALAGRADEEADDHSISGDTTADRTRSTRSKQGSKGSRPKLQRRVSFHSHTFGGCRSTRSSPQASDDDSENG